MTKRIRRPRCFLTMPHVSTSPILRKALEEGIESAGYDVLSVENMPILADHTIQGTAISAIADSDCIVASLSDENPNVFFELGLAQAMGKGILIVAAERALLTMPFDLRGFRILTYPDGLSDHHPLAQRIEASLREFRLFPETHRSLWSSQVPPPFYVDWESIDPRDAENLCRELLSQMGFRRLDWGKGFKEIDLIAELPKKDPDGFEYRELWMVALGLRAPIEMWLDVAAHDPDFFLRRVLKYSQRLEGVISRDFETSITLLIIMLRKSQFVEEMELLRNRMERRTVNQRYGWNVRLRIWDQDYLTSLVHRFPSIGFKYFSAEGRIRSRTRKSYEDLYREYSDLAARQTKLIRDLEDERNRRIRAERDSVWKDISFSAAHKIGNPIFAIETDLDPLMKRVTERRFSEAIEVISNIRSAVEKAKAFVEQFKSLAKAQEIKPIPLKLLPILQDSCKQVDNQGVQCSIQCPPEAKVLADPERLGECFDELVMNACHWFDKNEKIIKIDVVNPAPAPIPDFLDSSRKYVLVHVVDNGCGIQPAEKDRVFDAFFTKREHGTGLGLALVRRIIDGHGGGIIEVGSPGKGADFEVFLLQDGDDSVQKSTGKSIRRKSGRKEH